MIRSTLLAAGSALALVASLASAGHVSAPSSWRLTFDLSSRLTTWEGSPFLKGAHRINHPWTDWPEFTIGAQFRTKGVYVSDGLDGTWKNVTDARPYGNHDVHYIEHALVDVTADYAESFWIGGTVWKVNYGYDVSQSTNGQALSGTVNGKVRYTSPSNPGMTFEIKTIGTIAGVRD